MTTQDPSTTAELRQVRANARRSGKSAANLHLTQALAARRTVRAQLEHEPRLTREIDLDVDREEMRAAVLAGRRRPVGVGALRPEERLGVPGGIQVYPVVPAPPMFRVGAKDEHRTLAHHGLPTGWRARMGVSLAILVGLAWLVAAVMLAGCGGLPDMPSTSADGSGTGEGTGTGGNGSSGSGMVAGSSEGSGSTGSGSTGTGSSSTGNDGSRGSGGVACVIEGLECLCGGLPSDPFECVDECMWVDAPPDCMCDGMTAPPEWCEVSSDSTGDSTGD